MPIKAVLFDLQGVLLTRPAIDTSKHTFWETRLNLPPGEIERAFNGDLRSAEPLSLTPQSPAAAIWEKVLKHFNLTAAELTQLKADLLPPEHVDYGMLNLVTSLHRRYKTGLVSNIWLQDQDNLMTLYPSLNSALDIVVLAADGHPPKPHPAIYQKAVTLLHVAASECVFIDDLAANVAGAEAAGLIGVQYTDREVLIHDLTMLGITLD